MKKTYFLHDVHLGDCWAYINWLLNNVSDDINVFTKNYDRFVYYTKMLEFIHTEKNFIFNKNPEVLIKIGKKPFLCQTRYNKTKKNWNEHNKNIGVYYNFCASWLKEQKTPPNITMYENFLNKINNDLWNINGNMFGLELNDVIDKLSNCKIYVGTDHGISHVARSVGCPMILIEHQRPVELGFPKKFCDYILCNNIENFYEVIEKLIK